MNCLAQNVLTLSVRSCSSASPRLPRTGHVLQMPRGDDERLSQIQTACEVAIDREIINIIIIDVVCEVAY
jgi:hypothetical protein